MAAMKSLSLLGGLTPAAFLAEYWHKRPLLIRQAVPDLQDLPSRDRLFELAASDDVESRLIARTRSNWQVDHGPFPELPSPRRKNWTLLVQGVNLHDDATDALLRRFRFLPDARLDDVMISYATDGGGVGPHFDSYDVFLLQTHGRRLWRIGAQSDLSLVENAPLKILRRFAPEQEFVLEPGDMLYLPPNHAHEGVALGECATCSIGFRAPSYQELGEAFLQFMAETIDLPGRYADPDLAPTRHPAQIGKAMLARVTQELDKVRFTGADVSEFLGRYLSEPKPTVFFAAPDRPLPYGRFVQRAARVGVVLSSKSRMLYAGNVLFLNGESYQMGSRDRTLLKCFADRRSLDATEVAAASTDVKEALHQWHANGWLLLDGE